MTISSRLRRAAARGLRPAAALVGATLLAAPALAAQPAVPMELARLLVVPDPSMIAFVMFGASMTATKLPAAQITVGARPSRYPAALVPPAPFQALGGMEFGDESTRLIGTAPAGDAPAMAAARRVFERAGWTAVAPDASQRGGFQESPRPADSTSVYCHGDSVAMLGTGRSDTGLPYLGVSITTRMLAEVCRPHPPLARVPYEGMPIPTLVAPLGVTVLPDGGSGGSQDDYTLRTRMRTGLAPAALLAHYAPQLAAQGWTLHDRTAAPSVGAQSAGRDTAGTRWNATLVVARPPGSDEADVMFHLVRGARR